MIIMTVIVVGCICHVFCAQIYIKTKIRTQKYKFEGDVPIRAEKRHLTDTILGLMMVMMMMVMMMMMLMMVMMMVVMVMIAMLTRWTGSLGEISAAATVWISSALRPGESSLKVIAIIVVVVEGGE